MEPGRSIANFNRYMAKSKTVEAKDHLYQLYKGARMYYENTPQVSLEPVAPQFPGPSSGPTPPLGACCQGGDKCTPDAALWETPVWRALRFAMDRPHYYSYQYQADPTGNGFTVRAIGDIDCDGQYATFSMTGTLVDGQLPSYVPVAESDPME